MTLLLLSDDPRRCPSLGQTFEQLGGNCFSVEFFDECCHTRGARAGQLRGASRSHVQQLVRENLGPGRSGAQAAQLPVDFSP